MSISLDCVSIPGMVMLCALTGNKVVLPSEEFTGVNKPTNLWGAMAAFPNALKNASCQSGPRSHQRYQESLNNCSSSNHLALMAA